MAIQSFVNKNEEKYNVIFDDSSADVTIELEPLFYSEEKANLIHDRIFEFSIDSDVIELIKFIKKIIKKQLQFPFIVMQQEMEVNGRMLKGGKFMFLQMPLLILKN